MAFLRPSSSAAAAAFRSFARPTRGTAARTSARAWRCQRTIARRGYATEGGADEVPKSSSDIPWIIASVGVTVPAAYYMLQPSPHDPHGEHAHGHSEDEHEAERAEEHRKEVEQPTPQKVEAQAEKASVVAEQDLEKAAQTAEKQEGEGEKEAERAEKKQQDKKEEESEEGAEQKSPKEEKAEAAPGQHDVVPDTAVQPSEAPSKK